MSTHRFQICFTTRYRLNLQQVASLNMSAADFCRCHNQPCGSARRGPGTRPTFALDQRQTSRSKPTICRYTTAGFTLPALDGYGLQNLTLPRPAFTPLYPVPIRRLVPLLHASFRPYLAISPLRFATLHLHQAGRGLSPPRLCTCPAHVRHPPAKLVA